MQDTSILFLVLIGTIAGFLGGLLGLSGTVMMLPLLTLFNLFPDYQTAIGTILFCFEPFGSIFAIVQYAKEKRIDYLIGINIALSYMLGSYIGAKYHKQFTEKMLKNITATILLFLSMYMFYNASRVKS